MLAPPRSAGRPARGPGCPRSCSSRPRRGTRTRRRGPASRTPSRSARCAGAARPAPPVRPASGRPPGDRGGGDQAGADVAAGGEPAGDDREPHREQHRRQQRPPALVAEGVVAWVQPIGESQLRPLSATSPMARSTKATPSTAPAMPVRRPRRAGSPGRPTSATPANTRPSRRDGGAEQQRARRRQSRGHERDRDLTPTATEADPTTRPAASRRRWRPTTPARTQLGAAGLLLGAGVPPGQEHRHQRRADHCRGRDLEATMPADRVERDGRPAHRDRGRRWCRPWRRYVARACGVS